MIIDHPFEVVLYRYNLPYTVNAQYFRLYTPAGYIGTTEFKFYCNETTPDATSTAVVAKTADICLVCLFFCLFVCIKCVKNIKK